MPIQMTGRAIGEGIEEGFRQNIGRLASPEFGTETIYSFIIIACSLMIYFGTKELYELSSHKGIKYFRRAFLFFAIAYFFRSFIKFILIYFDTREILEVSHGILGMFFGKITLFIFMYFSAMAVFYLLYSVMWKKWNNSSKKIYLFHVLAFVIALSSIVFKNPFVNLGINLLLLLFVIFTLYISNKQLENKKTNYNLHVTYTLLTLFWIINIIDILIPNFLQTFQLFLYLASSGIFLVILYKVLKKAGSS